jgi:two-component system alkaline phosphatase synthesis response regulator PhoP
MGPRIILSVDDEPSILTLRQLTLQLAGYQVLNAADGHAALKTFMAGPVDLVLNGAQVAAQMKSLRPAVPILMLSASLRLPAPALEHVDYFIDKGQGPEVMLEKIDRLLSPTAMAARPAAA